MTTISLFHILFTETNEFLSCDDDFPTRYSISNSRLMEDKTFDMWEIEHLDDNKIKIFVELHDDLDNKKKLYLEKYVYDEYDEYEFDKEKDNHMFELTENSNEAIIVSLMGNQFVLEGHLCKLILSPFK